MKRYKAMDIIVSRTKTPVSWWIRVKTNSRWSHVALLGEDGDFVYTTSATGFKKVPVDKYKKGKTYAIYRHVAPELNEEQTRHGIAICKHQLGKPYAFRDVLFLLLQNLKGKGVERLEKNSKNYFCSEFTSFVYRKMGRVLHRFKEDSGVLPGDCVDLDEQILVESNDAELMLRNKRLIGRYKLL